jgi:hypothetical protein
MSGSLRRLLPKHEIQRDMFCRRFVTIGRDEQASPKQGVNLNLNPQEILAQSAPTTSVREDRPIRTTFRSRLEQELNHPHQKFVSKTRTIPKPKGNPKSIVTERVSLPTSSWVELLGAPPLATLDDVCNSVRQALDIERAIGIPDLDSPDCGLLTPSEPWIKSATFTLSESGRPRIWRIRLENRSIVHAFLEHAKQTKFRIVWKETAVKEWRTKTDEPQQLVVTDSMVRVENLPDKVTTEYVRHLFQRYDFSPTGPSVTRFDVKFKSKSFFVVHLADPANARAAVRELQGLDVLGTKLTAVQYPKTLI